MRIFLVGDARPGKAMLNVECWVLDVELRGKKSKTLSLAETQSTQRKKYILSSEVREATILPTLHALIGAEVKF